MGETNESPWPPFVALPIRCRGRPARGPPQGPGQHSIPLAAHRPPVGRLRADLDRTSLVTNASGGVVGQQRYYPYGAGRSTDTALPTDYRFTGQRQEGTIGLYDYGARFDDPLLGRFLSADTVVPEPGNPQALNRYSYCYNNPLRFVDPDGHDGGVTAALVAITVSIGPYVVIVGCTTYLVWYHIHPDAAKHRADLGKNVVHALDTVGSTAANAKEALVDAGKAFGSAIRQDVSAPASSLVAPTVVSPQVLELQKDQTRQKFPLPDPRQTAHYGKKPPSWQDLQLGGPNGSWKWWVLWFLLFGGLPCYYSQCSQSCTPPEEPPVVFEIVVEPTPKSPPTPSIAPSPSQKPWRPGNIPIEAL